MPIKSHVIKHPKRSPRRSRSSLTAPKEPRRPKSSLPQGVSFSRPIVKPKSDSSVSEPVSILKSPEATPMSSPKVVKKTRGPRMVLNPDEKVIVQTCKKIHPKKKYNQKQWLDFWKETRVPFFSKFRDILPQGIRLAVLNPERRYLMDLNALRMIDASDEERVRYYAHLAEEAIWNIR
jgi:hypothetical protein